MRAILAALRRQWRRSIVLAFALALAVGASGAFWAVVHAWLFTNGPVRDPATLGVLYGFNRRTGAYQMLSYPTIRFVSGAAKDMEVSAYSRTLVPVRDGNSTRGVWAALVSPSYFETLGVAMAGRGFSRSACTPDAVAVVSQGLGFLRGKAQATVAGRSYSILGSVPPGFSGVSEEWGEPPTIWFPVCDQAWVFPLQVPGQLTNPTIAWMLAVLRRPRTMSREQLAAQLHAISRRAVAQGYLPPDSEVVSIPYPEGRLWPTHRTQVAGAARLLTGGIGWLLLLAFLNAIGLFAAILLSRRTELATMRVLGASGWRVARESLHLALAIAAAAAAPSVALAWALVRVQPRLGGFLLLPLAHPATLSLRIVGLMVVADFVLAIAAAMVAVLVAGIMRGDLARELMGGAGRYALNLNPHLLLLAGQVASAAFIVVWAGALGAVYMQRASQAPGFKPGGIEVGTIATLFDAKTDSGKAAIYQRVLTDAKAKGETAALAQAFPGFPTRMSADVKSGARGAWDKVRINVVSGAYFGLLGIPVVVGRSFGFQDRDGGAPVAVVNAGLAEELWRGGATALNKFITVREWGVTARVVGVVSDVRFDGYGAEEPTVYLPLAQLPLPQLQVGVRGASALEFRNLMAEADPNLLVWDGVESLRGQLSAQLRRPRTEAVNVGTYAVLAVLVCFAGVVALTLLVMGLRRRGFAIRTALGGRPLEVAAEGVGRLCVACGCGAGAGAAIAAAVVRRALPGAAGGIVAGIGAVAAVGLWGAVVVMAVAIAYADAKRTDLVSLLRE